MDGFSSEEDNQHYLEATRKFNISNNQSNVPSDSSDDENNGLEHHDLNNSNLDGQNPKKSRKEYSWLQIVGETCYSQRQERSGQDLSTTKKKYKKMKCLVCAKFNPRTPWATLKARKSEVDSLDDHEKSAHHRKALILRNETLPVEQRVDILVPQTNSGNNSQSKRNFDVMNHNNMMLLAHNQMQQQQQLQLQQYQYAMLQNQQQHQQHGMNSVLPTMSHSQQGHIDSAGHHAGNENNNNTSDSTSDSEDEDDDDEEEESDNEGGPKTTNPSHNMEMEASHPIASIRQKKRNKLAKSQRKVHVDGTYLTPEQQIQLAHQQQFEILKQQHLHALHLQNLHQMNNTLNNNMNNNMSNNINMNNNNSIQNIQSMLNPTLDDCILLTPQPNQLESKTKNMPDWLHCEGALCHSSKQIASGRTNQIKKKYKMISCTLCADFNLLSPWSVARLRKFETSVIVEHERSHNHKKAIVNSMTTGPNGGKGNKPSVTSVTSAVGSGDGGIEFAQQMKIMEQQQTQQQSQLNISNLSNFSLPTVNKTNKGSLLNQHVLHEQHQFHVQQQHLIDEQQQEHNVSQQQLQAQQQLLEQNQQLV